MNDDRRDIRVAIVDDQALVRTGFRMVLEAEPDLVVVGEAGDGAAAVELARSTPVDVMLMDVRMPGVDGIVATAEVTGGPAAPRVIVLTTFDLDEYAFAAIRAGRPSGGSRWRRPGSPRMRTRRGRRS